MACDKTGKRSWSLLKNQGRIFHRLKNPCGCKCGKQVRKRLESLNIALLVKKPLQWSSKS